MREHDDKLNPFVPICRIQISFNFADPALVSFQRFLNLLLPPPPLVLAASSPLTSFSSLASLVQANASLKNSVRRSTYGAFIMLKWFPGIFRHTIFPSSKNSSQRFVPKSVLFSSSHCAWPYG